MELAWLVIKAMYRRMKYKTRYCTKIIKANRVLFEFSAGNGAGVRAGLRSSLHSLRIHLNCHLEILVHLCHLLLHWLRERENHGS